MLEFTYRIFTLGNKYCHNNKGEETIDGRPEHEEDEKFKICFGNDPSYPGELVILVGTISTRAIVASGGREAQTPAAPDRLENGSQVQLRENQTLLTMGRNDPSS